MITIKWTKVLFWRNRFAEHPVFTFGIDLPEPFEWQAFSINDQVREIINDAFPVGHQYAVAKTVHEFVARVALGIQKTYDVVPEIAGTHHDSDLTEATIHFACRDVHFGMVAANAAVFLTNQLAAIEGSSADDVEKSIDQIRKGCHSPGMDQTTRALAKAASRRGIPWFRISSTYRDIQLGQGHKQGRLRESMTSAQSFLAGVYSNSKDLTCRTIQKVGLPSGKFATVRGVEMAVKTAETMGFPVVLKPVHGHKGEDVAIDLRSSDEARDAASKIAKKNWPVLVQSFFPGADHRLLVVGGRFIAAARRVPASVVGDGVLSISTLIDKANTDPRRGFGFSRVMTLITIDDEVRRILRRQGLHLESVPGGGQAVTLRGTANISTGGSAIDVTDTIHPDNIRLAERTARALGLQVAGVDLICPDITRSWKEVGGGICEVNCCPGLRPHWVANPSMDVVAPILETIYPVGEQGRIPTAMITGTRGETSTAQILAGILAKVGHVVGCATTSGVEIGNEQIWQGNGAGVQGAATVMIDPLVTAAVLEIGREGLLERGMYLERCDVAALLNVEGEEIGDNGPTSLESVASLKRKVVDAAQEAVVLNADDKLCRDIMADLPPTKVIAFSSDPRNPSVERVLAAGGTSVFMRTSEAGNEIALARGSSVERIVGIAEISSSGETNGNQRVANTMAAASLAYGLGIPLSTIASCLR